MTHDWLMQLVCDDPDSGPGEHTVDVQLEDTCDGAGLTTLTVVDNSLQAVITHISPGSLRSFGELLIRWADRRLAEIN